MAGPLKVTYLQWGELTYTRTQDSIEPAIADDRVFLTAAVHLSHKRDSRNFQMRFTHNTDASNSVEVSVFHRPLSDADSRKKQKILHFESPELQCSKAYKCELVYKNRVIPLSRNELIINTPPARQDARPLKIALGGDQELFEQLGFVGRLFDLNNYAHTKKIYAHIGASGEPNASPDAPVDKQPYQLFIHIGDMMNGEIFFSFRNIFRRGRNFFERQAESVEAFDGHLFNDAIHPARTNLSRISYGFYNASDDHDTLGNGGGEPITDKDLRIRRNMQTSFHNNVLLPKFLLQESDGYGPVRTLDGRKGPYFKKRIGQHEIYILHNRMTQEAQAAADSFLLGEQQWAWLEDSLTTSQALHKIIISPLPFVMGKNPEEDYRGHPEEWHRLMQLCREYKIGTIFTADSHNYSHAQIYVRSHDEDTPWIINHQLVGTLGGSKQFITDEEMESLNKPGRPPLIAADIDGYDASLYRGTRVISYFSPGSKRALLPADIVGQDSVWSEEWKKNTHGYLSATFSFKNAIDAPEHSSSKDVSADESELSECHKWTARTRFFGCHGRNEVREINELTANYAGETVNP